MFWIGGFISADWKFELLLHCAKHLRLLRQAFPTIGIFESEEVVPRHAELQILQKHGADRPVCQWASICIWNQVAVVMRMTLQTPLIMLRRLQ
jgi:hypothetical protein